MGHIQFEGCSYQYERGDTVLDCLARADQNVAALCHAGACGVCTLVLIGGEVDAYAQARFSNTQRKRGLFLACRAPARSGMRLVKLRR